MGGEGSCGAGTGFRDLSVWERRTCERRRGPLRGWKRDQRRPSGSIGRRSGNRLSCRPISEREWSNAPYHSLGVTRELRPRAAAPGWCRPRPWPAGASLTRAAAGRVPGRPERASTCAAAGLVPRRPQGFASRGGPTGAGQSRARSRPGGGAVPTQPVRGGGGARPRGRTQGLEDRGQKDWWTGAAAGGEGAWQRPAAMATVMAATAAERAVLVRRAGQRAGWRGGGAKRDRQVCPAGGGVPLAAARRGARCAEAAAGYSQGNDPCPAPPGVATLLLISLAPPGAPRLRPERLLLAAAAAFKQGPASANSSRPRYTSTCVRAGASPDAGASKGLSPARPRIGEGRLGSQIILPLPGSVTLSQVTEPPWASLFSFCKREITAPASRGCSIDK